MLSHFACSQHALPPRKLSTCSPTFLPRSPTRSPTAQIAPLSSAPSMRSAPSCAGEIYYRHDLPHISHDLPELHPSSLRSRSELRSSLAGRPSLVTRDSLLSGVLDEGEASPTIPSTALCGLPMTFQGLPRPSAAFP